MWLLPEGLLPKYLVMEQCDIDSESLALESNLGSSPDSAIYLCNDTYSF